MAKRNKFIRDKLIVNEKLSKKRENKLTANAKATVS